MKTFIISLAVSVSVNPETGTNMFGILFLLFSYGLMGVLGSLTREVISK